jgi:hypothetical protein
MFALGALMFGLYVIFANWRDYGHILAPRHKPLKAELLLQSAAVPEEPRSFVEDSDLSALHPQPCEPTEQAEKPQR